MSSKLKHIILEGSLIKLRPIRGSDAHRAFPMLKNDKVSDWLLWDGPNNAGEVVCTYTQWEKEFGTARDYRFAIERLGCIDIRFPEHKDQADIGYWLGFPYWNNGYMTDALRLICNLCFKHLGIVRIYAPIFKGNSRSRRVLEKNGFSIDGTLRSHLLKKGEWRDVWFMSLLRLDWETKHS